MTLLASDRSATIPGKEALAGVGTVVMAPPDGSAAAHPSRASRAADPDRAKTTSPG